MTRAITSSEMLTFNHCRFKWLMQYHLELRKPPNRQSAAEIGSDIHACIAGALAGRKWQDVHEEIVDGRGLLPQDVNIVRAMQGWESERYRLYKNVTVQHIEEPMSVPLGALVPTIKTLAGVPDVVGTLDNLDGLPVVIDHKTSGKPYESWRQGAIIQAVYQLRVYSMLVPEYAEHGRPMQARVHYINTKTGHVVDTHHVFTDNQRGEFVRVIIDTANRIDFSIAFAVSHFNEVSRPEFDTWMTPGYQCSFCEYQQVCSQRIIGNRATTEQLEEAYVKIGRTAHHDKESR